jgi:transglutaminase-like putative cysteine protease
MPEYEYDYATKAKRVEKYGFGITQVNMLRDNGFSSRTLYMPSQSILRDISGGSQYLRTFGGSVDGNISYANFFDGLYTSYRAGLLTDEGYATVAMIQTMKSEAFYYNIAELIVELNTERYAIEKGISQKTDAKGGAVNELRYADGSKIIYTVQENTLTGETIIKIPQENGTAVYTCKDGSIARSMEDYEEVFDEEGQPVKLYAPALPLAVRYFEVMTSAERQEYQTLLRYIDLYTPYVYNTYMGKSDSTIIKELSDKIVSEATVEKYVEGEDGLTYLKEVPLDLSKAIGKSTYRETAGGEYRFFQGVTDGDVYKQRHELVMEVIDYLTDEENFTYTLSPTKKTDPSLDGVENFLTVTKEGYCVQFASAAALLIREAGIPVRYVEGYLATDFVSNNKDGAAGRYVTTVKDWNEHAWIEVWYDGLGWIQYETTPVFYDDYYDVGSSSSSDINRPWEDDEEEDTPDEEEDPYDGLTDYEIEQLIKEQEEAARRELIKKIIIYTSISVVAISLIVLFFALVVRRARRLQRERDGLLDALTATKDKDAQIPDRESVRRISEMISRLLSECKLSPRTGEFREEYALRVARECAGALSRPAASEKLHGFEAETSIVRERDVIAMFDALAAEEFGHGAPVEAMPTMAKFYRRIYASTYRRRANILRKIYLYFVKGEM